MTNATMPAPADVIPGITGAELQVMLAAAIRFQRDHAAFSPHAAAGITALTAPAPPDAAGVVRLRRSEYHNPRAAATAT